METLLEWDKQAAEVIWGALPGRPTISRRVGGRIGSTFSISEGTGTFIFHALLPFMILALIAVMAWVASAVVRLLK